MLSIEEAIAVAREFHPEWPLEVWANSDRVVCIPSPPPEQALGPGPIGIDLATGATKFFGSSEHPDDAVQGMTRVE